MAEQEGYLGSFGRSGGWARDDLAAVLFGSVRLSRPE